MTRNKRERERVSWWGVLTVALAQNLPLPTAEMRVRSYEGTEGDQ